MTGRLVKVGEQQTGRHQSSFVIRSEASISRSEMIAESKDPYSTTMSALRRLEILTVSGR